MFPQGPMRNQEKAFTTMQVTIGSNLAKKEAPMQAAFLGFASSPSETSRQSRLHPTRSPSRNRGGVWNFRQAAELKK
jgi:hypothetical protein